ncbi:MAG TPA: hypothetical protein PLV68_12975, partial [Ilumatobacteraceae bacterium]|nr:hypothetical protein [Ilumatobacteraceae bacterium]
AGYGERESPWGRPATWCPRCQPAPDVRGGELLRVSADAERAARLLALHPARREPAWTLGR